MALLLDLFGYLSIIVHGFTIVSQTVAIGSVLFIALLLRPLSPRLGAIGQNIERTCAAIAGWCAMGLVLCEVITIALQGAVLIGTVDLSLSEVLTASFAIAGIIKASAAALIALILFGRGQRAPITPLIALAAIELASATLTTHAEARLDDRTPCSSSNSSISSAQRSGSVAFPASWSRSTVSRTPRHGCLPASAIRTCRWWASAASS